MPDKSTIFEVLFVELDLDIPPFEIFLRISFDLIFNYS